MAEYIESAKMADVVHRYFVGYKVEDMIRDIRKEAIADVAPVVHGRWYDVNSYEHGEKAIATCSHCRVRGAVRTKRTEWGFWVIDSPVCPNCGARMDGEG